MDGFSKLFEAIDGTTKTNAKIDAIASYLDQAVEADKLFAIALLIGNKPKRPVKTTTLREWVADYTQLPLWLFEECYYVVGDLGETISLMISQITDQDSVSISLKELFELLVELQKYDVEKQREVVETFWKNLSGTPLYLFNKMLTGSFRIGVSKKIVIKAIAKHLNKEEKNIEHQMMGIWNPLEHTFKDMFPLEGLEVAHHIPYPFCLAYPLDIDYDALGPIENWFLEKKLDGIRGQIICRNNELFIWSRGEDLLTDKFPEFEALIHMLPAGTVLDGEIIPWKDGLPLPFSVMQTRIGRKNLSVKFLKEAPLIMVCYDLLEFEGKDLREEPLSVRRKLLEQLIADLEHQDILVLSERMHFDNWEAAGEFRDNARNYHCEGLMLKAENSIYNVGRKKGGWWKWKTAPLSIDGVMLYAQSGHGRRANLFTDYTFAVWDGDQLVPFAKAYSGLTDKEIGSLDRWIKANTIEKFGPVRSVKPIQVFEIGFEGINESSRHKSGVALRFPRILRWRTDKEPKQANTKDDLLQLLKLFES